MKAITDNDFTSAFIASDFASKRAQKFYIRIIATDLIFMLLSAAIATYNYQSDSSKQILYVITGMLMLLSLVLTVILLSLKYEDIWYQGRALAESSKTLAWRFMTRSELFEDPMSVAQATIVFTNRIKELGREFSELNKAINSRQANKPIVTQHMIDVRNLSLNERKQYYINYRIEDQKNWYANKAEKNKSSYGLWFAIIICAQTISLLTIGYMIAFPTANWNLVGLFTTISASAISWLQLKRHQELKQAYTTASQELNIISTLASQIASEIDFSKFVLDSENAISREHTLWLAQRRK